MSFDIIVPARLGSSRLPAKPLAELGGRPMLALVLERAAQAGAARVLAAVDSPVLCDIAADCGFAAVLTGSCANGTERVAAAAAQLAPAGVIVNLQCDEPFISPATIAACAQLAERARHCATAAAPATAAELRDPEVVKVVLDRDSKALYFSRAPIPHRRGRMPAAAPAALAHIGVYAFRSLACLRELSGLPECALERAERLEQLRWLWHGYDIEVATVDDRPHGIDTPADLQKARARCGGG